MECTNFIFIWHFNRNLWGVFYETHLTFFILLFIYTSEPVNMCRHQELQQPGDDPQQVLLQQPEDDAWREEHVGSGDL